MEVGWGFSPTHLLASFSPVCVVWAGFVCVSGLSAICMHEVSVISCVVGVAGVCDELKSDVYV